MFSALKLAIPVLHNLEMQIFPNRHRMIELEST